MSIKRIAVVGLGQMGQGILQRLIEAGIPATGVARREEALEPVRKALEAGTRMAVRRKRCTAEALEAGMTGLLLTTEQKQAGEAELVIEAIAEDYHTKVEVLSLLQGLIPAEATLASNTSSLSIKRLGAECGCSERLVGLHFMNPVPSSSLVELVTVEGQNETHHERARHLAEALKLTVVEVRD
ncbi:MAG: 3-hydroxyacyl-CoA dehydrogenase family protein, partial [Planctomycetota bacterium]